ncbi:MAG: heat shock protein Hsp20 [Candidatus Hecatellales archaeon B24]|nr:MAG: heat shock protein Hsp20 [Candidatus Hecatellales archaeon B24]
MERFGRRRFSPLLAGLSLLSLPVKILGELSEVPEKDWERFLEKLFRKMVEVAPKSLVKERKLPNGTVIREVGPIVWGITFKLDFEGKPVIKSFGNVKPSMLRAFTEPFTVGEHREPLYDLSEEDGSLKITVEIPGASKEQIQVTATEKTLTVNAQGKGRTYFREIELPAEVEPKNARSTYADGILEVTLPKKEAPPKLKGEPIKIE